MFLGTLFPYPQKFYHFKAMSGNKIWNNEWLYGLNGLVLGVQLS